VDGGIAAGRVLDPDPVVQDFAGDVVIDLSDAAAELGTRLIPRLRAAIERDRAAWSQRPGLRLNIDDTSGPQTVLCRQRAGDQRHGIGKPRLQCLAEDIDALRELNPVDAVLQIGVVAANVDLPERVLRDTGAWSSSWFSC